MNSNACYLYGVVLSPSGAELGNIGLEGEMVHAVPLDDIAAVIHDCSEKAYLSEDRETLKSWLMAHQAVVELVWEKYGAIVPISFGTVVKGGREALLGWLAKNHGKLASRLAYLSGKAEYGVQLSWDEKEVNEEIIKSDEEIKRLQKEEGISSKGTAYLYQKRMENLIRDGFNKRADEFRNSIHEKMKEITNDVIIEKLKGETGGQRMIMNVSCLIRRQDEGRLGLILEEAASHGCNVKFTGPWPPYSFSRC